MLLSTEARQAYSDLLVKAQAYEICASIFTPVDFKSIHAELVVLYKFKMQNDEVEVKSRIERINSMLDRKIEACDSEVRSKIVDFINERNKNTWMYSKLEGISDAVNMILRTAERIEDHVDPKLKHARIIQPAATPAPVERKVEIAAKTPDKHAIKLPTLIKCNVCGKRKGKDEYYPSDIEGSYFRCKECRKSVTENAWIREHAVEFKFVKEAVEKRKAGSTFTLQEIAEETGVKGYNCATTISCLNRCEKDKMIKTVEVGNKKKNGRKYVRL